MTGKITTTIIKPEAVRKDYPGDIIKMITDSGFRIAALKMIELTRHEMEEFYDIHRGKHFFDDLISYMTDGPVIVAVLEKENAVEDFRTLIGATNPKDAADGTIRKIYGETIQLNAVHGSDSNENAKLEADFFFSHLERYFSEK